MRLAIEVVLGADRGNLGNILSLGSKGFFQTRITYQLDGILGTKLLSISFF